MLDAVPFRRPVPTKLNLDIQPQASIELRGSNVVPDRPDQLEKDDLRESATVQDGVRSKVG